MFYQLIGSSDMQKSSTFENCLLSIDSGDFRFKYFFVNNKKNE